MMTNMSALKVFCHIILYSIFLSCVASSQDTDRGIVINHDGLCDRYFHSSRDNSSSNATDRLLLDTNAFIGDITPTVPYPSMMVNVTLFVRYTPWQNKVFAIGSQFISLEKCISVEKNMSVKLYYTPGNSEGEIAVNVYSGDGCGTAYASGYANFNDCIEGVLSSGYLIYFQVNAYKTVHYQVTLKEADDKNMYTGLWIYNGNVGACNRDCHLGSEYYCKYTIEDQTNIVLTAHLNAECTDGSAKERLVIEPGKILHVGKKYISAVAEEVNKDSILYNYCKLYNGSESRSNYRGMVPFNMCIRDPMGFGYVQVITLGRGYLVPMYYSDYQCQQVISLPEGDGDCNNGGICLIHLLLPNGQEFSFNVTTFCYMYA